MKKKGGRLDAVCDEKGGQGQWRNTEGSATGPLPLLAFPTAQGTLKKCTFSKRSAKNHRLTALASSTAPVQPIFAKMGKKIHCAESKGKRENAERSPIFSKLAKILDFLDVRELVAPGAPFFKTVLQTPDFTGFSRAPANFARLSSRPLRQNHLNQPLTTSPAPDYSDQWWCRHSTVRSHWLPSRKQSCRRG